MDNIDHLDSVVDGEHFMRAIIDHLEGQRRRGRHGDRFVNSQVEHWYVKWDWVRHGSEVELKINNTDMVHTGRLNTTKVAIDVALALKIGWLIQEENQIIPWVPICIGNTSSVISIDPGFVRSSKAFPISRPVPIGPICPTNAA